MSVNTLPCSDSFTFFSSAPLVIQQPSTYRLLVVIPVRRDCCSWQCDSSVRVTYFTAPTSSNIESARPGVDFIEGRGSVLFDVGQQRAQVAVEVLPALADDSTPYQRAFAIVVEAPVTITRVLTEIIVEPTYVHSDTSLPLVEPRICATYTAVGILAGVAIMALVMCWLRVRWCSLPRRTRPFEYKLLLLPRRDSGVSEETREGLVSINGQPVKKTGARRSARRSSSFRNWKVITERYRQEGSDPVVPEDELSDEVRAAVAKREKEKASSEETENDSDPERDLREHLASIQGVTRQL